MALNQAAAEIDDGESAPAGLPVDQDDLVAALRLHRVPRPCVTVHECLRQSRRCLLHVSHRSTERGEHRLPVRRHPAGHRIEPGDGDGSGDSGMAGRQPGLAVRVHVSSDGVQRPERRAQRPELRERRRQHVAGHIRCRPAQPRLLYPDQLAGPGQHRARRRVPGDGETGQRARPAEQPVRDRFADQAAAVDGHWLVGPERADDLLSAVRQRDQVRDARLANGAGRHPDARRSGRPLVVLIEQPADQRRIVHDMAYGGRCLLGPRTFASARSTSSARPAAPSRQSPPRQRRRRSRSRPAGRQRRSHGTQPHRAAGPDARFRTPGTGRALLPSQPPAGSQDRREPDGLRGRRAARDSPRGRDRPAGFRTDNRASSLSRFCRPVSKRRAPG